MTTRPIMKPLAEYIPTPPKTFVRTLGASKCCCCGRKASSKSFVVTWKEAGETYACSLDHISYLSKLHPETRTLNDLLDIYPDTLWIKHLGKSCFNHIHKQTPGSYVISTKGGAHYLILA
jgi:hypothetical protein